MSKVIVLDENFTKNSEIDLPEKFEKAKEHNLYLYIKYYLSKTRKNIAHTKTRGNVSGGGKKPWAQKGGGRARAGSITSPIFVGGGVSHGPSNKRNYDIKLNKKQRFLALQYALRQKAEARSLFIVDNIYIESGKTKDAYNLFKNLNQKNVLLVTEECVESTFLAFRNIAKCYLIDEPELNAYLVANFRSVVIERDIFKAINGEF